MHGKAQGNRHLAARLVLGILQNFTQQAQAVLETAAIGIAALVVDRRQEVPQVRRARMSAMSMARAMKGISAFSVGKVDGPKAG
jgi:hypothetical protein